ncbi:MAG TPA: hypothetical protein VHD89_09915 [Rhodanobacteraceae bacterium]|jgi:hypothetical protein|nr:hypothetical protein [Rhodanobacteraceae bacterium]
MKPECFRVTPRHFFAAKEPAMASTSFDPSDPEMPLTPDRIRDEWPRLGDRLRRRWRKLTREDVAFPEGNATYLAGLLQQRYGVDRREALLQVFEFESEL